MAFLLSMTTRIYQLRWSQFSKQRQKVTGGALSAYSNHIDTLEPKTSGKTFLSLSTTLM